MSIEQTDSNDFFLIHNKTAKIVEVNKMKLGKASKGSDGIMVEMVEALDEFTLD